MQADKPNDDLLDGILPTQPEKPVAPPRKHFKPWHRPRKQYVRRFQWLHEIQRLIEEMHFPEDSRIFRYLSLPGNDLLDVRSIQEVCVANELFLKYTGLNAVAPGSADHIELNLAVNDVNSLRGIHSQSIVLLEKLEAVAEPSSIAYGHVAQTGPYHCINIDLCGHLALKPQMSSTPTYIDAIAQLIQFQIQFGAQAWLLFLTARVDPDSVNTGNLHALIEAIQVNMLHHPPFRDGLAALICSKGDELNQKLKATRMLTPGQFKDIFCIGFGKWLLAYLQAAQPRMDCTKLPSYYYSVHSGRPDMVALAYKCEPRIVLPRDQYKLVADPLQEPRMSESQIAMTFLDATGSMPSVDEILAYNPEIMSRMIQETEGLLRAAGYPVDDTESGYKSWLQGGARYGHPIPSSD